MGILTVAITEAWLMHLDLLGITSYFFPWDNHLIYGDTRWAGWETYCRGP
jgi:hypothetical protein